jgi:uncharacterized protein
MKLIRAIVLFVATLSSFGLSPASAEAVKWSGWGDDVFGRASAEKRFVILDLEAVWCHWCHVMEKTTYADPQVTRVINA